MQYSLDILFVALAIVIIVAAAKKGFVKSFLDSVSTLLAGGIAYFTAQPVSEVVYEKGVRDTVEKSLVEALAENSDDISNVSESVNVMLEQLPEGLVSFASSKLDVDVSGIISEIQNSGITDAETLVSTLMTSVADGVLISLTKVVCMIVIFVLSTIILSYVSRLFSGVVSKIPIVKQFNKLLGGAIGVFKAVVILFVAATVIFFIEGSLQDGKLLTYIDSSVIYELLIKYNPLLNLFNK